MALTAAILAVLLAGPRERSAHAQARAKPAIVSAQLGFDGAFKLGCWTQLEVVLKGGDAPLMGLVEASTRDSDGVPTSLFSSPGRPVGLQPGQTTTVRMFVRCGQDGASLRIRFLDETGKERASRTFRPAPEPADGYVRFGLPATNRLIVSFGMTSGVGDVLRGPQAEGDQQNSDHAVRVENAASLPLQWYGYEGVEAVVLGSAAPELFRPLAASPQRVDALREWVESGGQLIIFCGESAPELIGPGGPLASLAPGDYETLAPLRESSPLELFSGSDEPVNRGRPLEMQVPRLVNVRGRILAYAGAEPADLPLVVRERRGLGEVTFVAVDPEAAPIAGWGGRTALVRQALRWPATPGRAADESYAYGESVKADMINQLRSAMDRQFTNIRTAPFAMVALLVVVYILLIGPGDYFFVKRVLKRMELTWITFPLIVATVSIGAYWLAYAMKGDKLRVNQVEIVDFDLEAGDARGTVWTHFFNPHVERYDLRLAPRFAKHAVGEGERSGADGQQLVAWLGAPGHGLGGMQGQVSRTALFEQGYAIPPALNAIQGLPVQEWSTKSLVGRWRAEVAVPLEASLAGLPNELLAGSLGNQTGLSLHDCLLMHGNWAYELGEIAAGQSVAIDDSLQPRPVATALASLGDDAAAASSDNTGLAAYSEDVNHIVRTMMFYKAIGGDAYAPAPHRYQAFVDLSHLLQGNQAILLARADGDDGSRWMHGQQLLTSDQDRRWVFYRFIIPLSPERPDAPGPSDVIGPQPAP